MNECLFIFHILAILGCCRIALFLGKEALVFWVAFQPILANLFVFKQITLFGFEVTCSDVYVVGSVCGLNFIQEFFSKDLAKKASSLSLYALFFFIGMGVIHLCYIPSLHDTAHPSYTTLFSYVPRVALASVSTFAFVQRFDIFFFGLLQKTSYSLLIRNMIALVLSQCIDTLLFTFLGLWGIVESFFDVFFVSFLVKVFCILFLVLLSPRKYQREVVSF
jgi:uncharacterized integral membrane protein (TIGR00697 family)